MFRWYTFRPIDLSNQPAARMGAIGRQPARLAAIRRQPARLGAIGRHLVVTSSLCLHVLRLHVLRLHVSSYLAHSKIYIDGALEFFQDSSVVLSYAYHIPTIVDCNNLLGQDVVRLHSKWRDAVRLHLKGRDTDYGIWARCWLLGKVFTIVVTVEFETSVAVPYKYHPIALWVVVASWLRSWYWTW